MNLNLDSVLERYKLAERRDYQVSSITSVVQGINSGADVFIDLPTGMGKTIIYSPVAAEGAESGYRVAILAATKQAQKRIKTEVDKFAKTLPSSLVFGIAEYYCPLLKANAQTWCCSDYKEDHCKPTNIGCDVIKAEDIYNNKKLVITNFSKFLLSSRETPYDLIIIDDSHSFENAKEQAYQIGLQFGSIKEFYEKRKSDNPLYEFIADFLNLYLDIFERCVNPGQYDGVISPDYIKHMAEDLITDENSEQIREIMKALPDPARSLCLQIYYFIDRAKRSSSYQFYVRKDYYDPDDVDSSEIFCRSDERTIENIIKRRFGQSRVVYATATPGDIKTHARSCTLRNYENDGLIATLGESNQIHEVDSWFDKLSILIVEDIDDTRKQNSFDKAIRLSTEILKTINKRTLLLFKNYRDQRTARDLLSQVFGSDKLFFIDSSIQSNDIIEEYASNHQISLASASSTVWEGININRLRLAIVLSAPFIRPPVGSKRYSYTYSERRMLMRLQQGIGRIIRSPSDYGVALLMENRFKQYVGKRVFSDRLKKRVKYTHSSDVISELNKIFLQWEDK